MLTADEIKAEALRLGFDACGIAAAAPLDDDAQYLQNWLAEGHHADMHYMQNHTELRANPQQLFDGAKSVIVVLLNYYHEQNKNAKWQIAKYAYFTDYHHMIKQKLRQLQQFIDQHAEQRSQICCDTAPLFERRLAERAGLGWIGKSNLLVSRQFGTYTLIGELVTSLELPPDTPHKNFCGKCQKCLENCPNGALFQVNKLDARRCISYLTIEQKGELTHEQSALCNDMLFGCDRCLDVCPWNRFTNPTHLETEKAVKEIDFATLNASQFRKKLGHTPLNRAGFKKLQARAQQIEQLRKDSAKR